MMLKPRENSNEGVWDTFNSISNSGIFSKGSRALSLLEYLLYEVLEGRGERLKAYSIAIDVFEKDDNFDPSTDSTIRVEMHRLRKGLNAYYALNMNPPVTITFSKGSYRARIRPNYKTSKENEVRSPKQSSQESLNSHHPKAHPATFFIRIFNRNSTLLVSVAFLGIVLLLFSGPLLENSESSIFKYNRCSREIPNVRLIEVASDNYDRVAELAHRTILDTLSQYSSINVVRHNTKCSTDTPFYSIQFFIAPFGNENRVEFITKHEESGDIVASSGFTDTERIAEFINNVRMNIGDLALPYGIIPKHAISVDWADNQTRQSMVCIIQMHTAFVEDKTSDVHDGFACMERQLASGQASANMMALLSYYDLLAPRTFGLPDGDTIDHQARAIKLIDQAVATQPDSAYVRLHELSVMNLHDPSKTNRTKEALKSMERQFANNSLAMLYASYTKGYVLGDWQNAVNLERSVREFHRERDASMFRVEMGYAIIFSPRAELMEKCELSYSIEDVTPNIRMLACAKLAGDEGWRQSVHQKLTEYDLGTLEKQIQFVHGHNWEPVITQRIIDALSM